MRLLDFLDKVTTIEGVPIDNVREELIAAPDLGIEYPTITDPNTEKPILLRCIKEYYTRDHKKIKVKTKSRACLEINKELGIYRNNKISCRQCHLQCLQHLVEGNIYRLLKN